MILLPTNASADGWKKSPDQSVLVDRKDTFMLATAKETWFRKEIGERRESSNKMKSISSSLYLELSPVKFTGHTILILLMVKRSEPE